MFNTLYKFFKNKRLLLTLFIFIISGAAIFTALKIKTSENIAEMIPADDELQRFNFANRHIKINDKIIKPNEKIKIDVSEIPDGLFVINKNDIDNMYNTITG